MSANAGTCLYKRHDVKTKITSKHCNFAKYFFEGIVKRNGPLLSLNTMAF